MELHYATALEAMADALGDTPAQIAGNKHISWTDFERRSARLVTALQQAGLGKDSKVGLLLYNGVEYPEAHLAALKMRGQPINMNYRYVADELVYLAENADMEAIIYDGSMADRIEAIRDKLPKVKVLIELADGNAVLPGALSYDDIVENYEPAPRIERSGDDVFMMYTGGTTGMPKGVMYALRDMSFGMANLLAMVTGGDPVETVENVVNRAVALKAAGQTFISLPGSPMMHTAALMNGTMAIQMMGGTVVSLKGRSFDADEFFETVQREKVNFAVIVGDAFARPMVEALQAAADRGKPYDVSSLKLIVSSGVMWSAEVKQGLLDWGDMTLIDGMGATEGGMGAMVSSRQAPPTGTAKFIKMADTKLFTEDLQEIPEDSEEPGLIAAGGVTVPMGYYKDEAKSAATFKDIDGKRYAFTGDWGHYGPDGSITFLGRGSGCINTAGEKVYPEEVEEILKTMPEIDDCLVVGVADERFGQAVSAVIQTSNGQPLATESIADFCKQKLAGYKRPRKVVFTDKVKRAPNGKPDYKWARQLVIDSLD